METTDYTSFKRIINDFMTDLGNTFPEYVPLLQKHLAQAELDDYAALYAHCQQTYPPQFFNILYKTTGEDSAPLLLLPEIDFRPIVGSLEITEQTRDSLWQYLQLILFTIIGTIKDRTAFGEDTANLFGAISPEEMQAKMSEVIANMQDILGATGAVPGSASADASETPAFPFDMSGNMPDANDLHNHLNDILGGQIGKFAAEITEEWATEFGINLDDTAINSQQGMTEFFMKLMKDPSRLYTLIKRIGERFEAKLKSGELSQKEMEREAKELAEKLKNIPGMEKWGATLSGMTQGRGGRGSGANNAAAAASADIIGLRKQLEFEQMKERLRAKREQRTTAANVKKAAATAKFVPDAPAPIPCSDEELIAMFEPKSKGKGNNGTVNKKK